ncbi:hypothetical protein SDC9_154149 [bioreactor metagenome]|uniref:Carboxypeptidase regulatory-like domain-containing protein n=1 Tax=bioreactor metagenome TaxID=1076179 RepID=A0A645F065_9ZZZZ
MLFFGGAGILLAFVPFEDRPLEVWIKAFIKSIYSPTIYTYKKKTVENWLDLDLSKNISTATTNAKVPSGNERENSLKKSGMKLGDYLQMNSLTDKKNEPVEINNKIDENQVIKTEVEVKEVKIEPEVKIEKNENKEMNTADWRDTKTGLDLKSEKLGATGEAVFGTIPMPDIPEIANVVVGMATSNEGKIIDGVIVEIQDEHGNPSRVLKTNSLGQFKTSTPLADGKYLLIAEKDGYIFDWVNLELSNQIVQPIKIIAHN